MSADRPEPPSAGRREFVACPPAEALREDVTSAPVSQSATSRHRREMASGLNLFTPGSHIGRYKLLAPLASGGMAQVWAAKPEGTGFARTIALKLIRQEYAADDEYARMFIDEATVAASIRHPNVCETYELGRQDGVLFMAIEWVAGDSLAGILHRDQGLEPIPMTLAARVVADACAGLHAAHEAVGPDGSLLGVVHRDVSPPNILLSLQGQVKVSDFGIAKARFQLHSRTRTGEIKGKFAYIAPEQIGGRNIDRRVDIFALGCVLYVATVGLRPFGSGPRAMSKILSGDYKRPSSLVEGYPVELERVIARCLQKSPADRFSTADEMRTELERWLLAAPTPIGTNDLAALVSARLDLSKRGVVETLMRSNQFLPEAMVYQLVRKEVEQTPTATSSVMFGPASLTVLDVAEPVAADGPRPQSQRPMVRFTALGPPIAPDPIEAAEPGRPLRQAAQRAHAADLDEGTISEGSIAGMLPSSGPPHGAASMAPTFRPPRLGPLRHAQTRPFWRSAPLVAGLGLLVALALGWGSCQFFPP